MARKVQLDKFKDTFFDCVIVRYGEIALKGKNRVYFEKKLSDSLSRALKYAEVPFSRIERIRGRIIVYGNDSRTASVLAKVFGVVSTSPALSVSLDIDKITEKMLLVLENEFKKHPDYSSFKVSTNRLVKSFALKSTELNTNLGEAVLSKHPELKVKLKEPDITLGLEISQNAAFVYVKKYAGVGGLPIGSSGTAVSLFSGGLDSPVSSFMAMKRGCNLVLLHFFNELSGGTDAPVKILELFKILKKYNPMLKLLLVPFSDVEREIVKKVPSKYRIILLRILFLKYVEMNFPSHIPIITGDNLGQVASQTLKNLYVISSFTNRMILRPLIGFDKVDIINFAREIGTYEESIKPYADCCNFLLPRHPETNARIGEIKKILSTIDLSLVEKAIQNSKEY